jgi:hypothetical protein
MEGYTKGYIHPSGTLSKVSQTLAKNCKNKDLEMPKSAG